MKPAARHAARRLSRSGQTAGTTSTNSRDRARSSSTGTSRVYFADDKLTRWEGDEMPESVVELNRSAARGAARRAPRPKERRGCVSRVPRYVQRERVTPCGAHCHRRRRRPHGPGADRRDRSPLPDLDARRARSTSRGSPLIGVDAGAQLGRATGVPISADVDAAVAQRRRADRFHTARRARSRTSRRAHAHGVAAVVGTTGFDADGKRRSPNARRRFPSCWRRT